MLTHHCKSVYLSLTSTDLPIWSVVETAVTLYQKDHNRFHLLLTTPSLKNCEVGNFFNLEKVPCQEQGNANVPNGGRILWLEISPQRIIMTMQGNAQLNYRHSWEQGVYGVTCYWLPTDSSQHNKPIRLRNFTRSVTLSGHPLPEYLRVEYELWVGELQVGHYILNLEIKH
ncbi:hypothetical protein [Mastigocladopsis repens]|uniref:hypothetical protein n=1 Tax=Mastigocladopsis repens TaxID=221287 RepID=UPI00037687F9|nr:hypothetical protein [Mastigocladopsis repens]